MARANFVQRVSRARVTVLIGSVALCPGIASASGDAGLVPMSWALDVRSGSSRNIAVAVPWSLDYARLPLMKQPPLFRFFPHVSLLGSGDAKTATLVSNPRFTMGCGVGLANAIAVGVGVQVDSPFAHAYVMAGLSLTDIARFAF